MVIYSICKSNIKNNRIYWDGSNIKHRDSFNWFCYWSNERQECRPLFEVCLIMFIVNLKRKNWKTFVIITVVQPRCELQNISAFYIFNWPIFLFFNFALANCFYSLSIQFTKKRKSIIRERNSSVNFLKNRSHIGALKLNSKQRCKITKNCFSSKK